jgi:hypothetical protein
LLLLLGLWVLSAVRKVEEGRERERRGERGREGLVGAEKKET